MCEQNAELDEQFIPDRPGPRRDLPQCGEAREFGTGEKAAQQNTINYSYQLTTVRKFSTKDRYESESDRAEYKYI